MPGLLQNLAVLSILLPEFIYGARHSDSPCLCELCESLMTRLGFTSDDDKGRKSYVVFIITILTLLSTYRLILPVGRGSTATYCNKPKIRMREVIEICGFKQKRINHG